MQTAAASTLLVGVPVATKASAALSPAEDKLKGKIRNILSYYEKGDFFFETTTDNDVRITGGIPLLQHDLMTKSIVDFVHDCYHTTNGHMCSTINHKKQCLEFKGFKNADIHSFVDISGGDLEKSTIRCLMQLHCLLETKKLQSVWEPSKFKGIATIGEYNALIVQEKTWTIFISDNYDFEYFCYSDLEQIKKNMRRGDYMSFEGQA